MHGDFLMSFTLLPEIEGVSHGLLPSTDDHALDVVFEDDVVAHANFLPLEEVLTNLSVDTLLDGVETSVAARSYSFLSLDLDRLVQRLHSG